MQIETTTYADFLSLTNTKVTKNNVFYYSVSGTFNIYVVDGSVVYAKGQSSAPATFATDFPSAIALTTDLIVVK